MRLWSDSFKDGAAIPAKNAFGRYNRDSNVELSDNLNPHVAWTDLPVGTKSLALICCDVDVPTRPDNVNKAGMTVPFGLPRADFYHWIVVDLAPQPARIAEGEFASGVVARGKDGPRGPRGTRCGINDYTGWFSGDADMAGEYYGYDGPCPPWNDERIHRYQFTLYALDVDKAPVKGKLAGADVIAAIEPHVLDEATIVGTYHIYPRAKEKE